MRRRNFLKCAAGAACWPALSTSLLAADELPADLRIERIVGFDLTSQRAKLAGKNSRLDVHGDRATDRMVRVYASDGSDGVGTCRASEETLVKLVGQPLGPVLAGLGGKLHAQVDRGTMPFWDLLGKQQGKPVYELLGARGAERVPVYDGSIYFQDLLPEYADAWEDRFRRELDDSQRRGHRAVKVKIGRGAKWMPREEGNARDVAVLETIRAHVGREFLIGVDANNGYDLAGTKRLLDRLSNFDFAFVEEMFEENVEECLALKQFIAERGWKTRVADGETQGSLEPFRPLVKARALDILQADMNRFGVEGILEEAELAEAEGILVAPHNWGSLVGYYLQLHIGRAIPNFYRAENDPLASRALVAEGYKIENGESTVSDAPGFGLAIDERALADEAKVRFDLRA